MNSNSWLPLIFEVAKWERQEAVKHFLHSLESMQIVFFWQLMWTLTSRLMCGQMSFNSNIWPSGPMSSFCHQANQQVVPGPVLLERVNRKVGFRDSKTPLLREKQNLCFPASCGISLGWWWVLWNLRWNEPCSPHSYVSLCLISVLFLANDYCPWHCLPLHTSLQDSGRVCHFPTQMTGCATNWGCWGPRSRWKLWLLQGFSCLRCSPRKDDDDFSGVFLSVWILSLCFYSVWKRWWTGYRHSKESRT